MNDQNIGHYQTNPMSTLADPVIKPDFAVMTKKTRVKQDASGATILMITNKTSYAYYNTMSAF